MYMDFAQPLLEERGYGEYVRLPLADLPLLWLAFLSDPSNSGKIHSDVKTRWQQGDKEVRRSMCTPTYHAYCTYYTYCTCHAYYP